MFNIIRIHTPAVPLPDNVVRISILTTIPAELREAIHIINGKLELDSNDGIKTVPTGSLIGFEKSDKTPSGYHCWVAATPHTNLISIDGVLCTKPIIRHSMLIPDKDEARPLWVAHSHITYNGDGTATIHTDEGDFTGRIGIDFLVCNGMKKNGPYNVSLLTRSDKSYNDFIVCDENRNPIGKLSDIYPA